MGDVYLSSSAINSGSPVYLGASEITYAHKNFVRSPTIAGYLTTSDAISAVDHMGWENPLITMQGYFNEKNPKSNGATVSLMKAFIKSTGNTYIYDDIFFTTSTLIKLIDLKMNRTAKDSSPETGSEFTKGNLVNFTINAVLTL